jgi:hypothetical protein
MIITYGSAACPRCRARRQKPCGRAVGHSCAVVVPESKFELRMKVLAARMVEGKGVKEISEEFGVPERTVTRWLQGVPRGPTGRC